MWEENTGGYNWFLFWSKRVNLQESLEQWWSFIKCQTLCPWFLEGHSRWKIDLGRKIDWSKWCCPWGKPSTESFSRTFYQVGSGCPQGTHYHFEKSACQYMCVHEWETNKPEGKTEEWDGLETRPHKEPFKAWNCLSWRSKCSEEKRVLTSSLKCCDKV